jgi:methionyl-tRNA formyltransferase
MVLAMNPEPGAWTTLNGDTFKIHEAREIAKDGSLAAGSISFEDGRVVVCTVEGVVELLTVQPAGKQSMTASEWARGITLPLRCDA